jgi:hypothetical protein
MSDEGGLDGMEFVPASDTLDREDFSAVIAERQSQARIDPTSVDQDRARAALAAVASLLGPRQVKTLTQKIEERDAWVSQRDVPPYAVHGEADGEIHGVLRTVLFSIGSRPSHAQRGEVWLAAPRDRAFGDAVFVGSPSSATSRVAAYALDVLVGS